MLTQEGTIRPVAAQSTSTDEKLAEIAVVESGGGLLHVYGAGEKINLKQEWKRVVLYPEHTAWEAV